MKKKYTIEELSIIFIDAQLEKYNLTYSDILNEEYWYDKYTATKEEDIAWSNFCKYLLKHHCKRKIYHIDKQFAWFNLCYGLKVKN